MAYIDTDTVVHIYQTAGEKTVGQLSSYTDKVHPGTGNKIYGWKWNERVWPTEGEFRAVAYAPTIWDPSITDLEETDWQAGYGDNKDLLLLGIEETIANNTNVWAPKIQHGYFYTIDEEWYLYSDGYLTEYFSVSGVESSKQVLTLSRSYKPTIPIQARTYTYNRTKARYEIYRNFRKVVEFSDDPDGPEFTVDTTTNPPKLILDDIYDDTVGSLITLTSSGTANPDDIYDLDIVGMSDGSDSQEFNLLYAPVDPNTPAQVWSWVDANWPTRWSIIDTVSGFTLGEKEVKLDRDRGTILFGTVASGVVPAAGHKIGVFYTPGIAAIYEPEDTVDSILAYNDDANVDPILASTSVGFVQVSTASVDPASVVLSSELTFSVNSYLISLGNNIGKMIAEVKNSAGDLLEGQEVTFEIIEPQVGSFGGTARTTTAITGSDGEAVTYYNSPSTITNLGRATTDAVLGTGADTGKTFVTVDGVVEPSSVTDLYIYKVHTADDVLGVLDTELETYYEDYLDDEGMTDGVQGTVDYEEDYRNYNDLGIPTTYTSTDYTTGKKTIILTTSGIVMNPHTGYIQTSGLMPLTPTAIDNIGTVEEPSLYITYDQVLSIPGTGDTRSYFIIGDAKVQIRAYVVNQRTNRRIYSNTINVDVQIPDLVNGTYYCSVLNDVPDGLLTKTKNIDDLSNAEINSTSGVLDYWEEYEDEKLWIPASGAHEDYVAWFRRTRRGDTVGLTLASLAVPDPNLDGLEEVTPMQCPAYIPLGFRLRSTGVTIASVLDQVTYLDPNDHLASGYFS